jgi:ABC-type multidrug transport system ATPase subunit
MIEARELIKHYGPHRVLNGASVRLEPGEYHVLTGDNGSGKTTLLHVIMGLRVPDRGEVLWKGRPLTGGSRRAWRRVRAAWGFLPQQVSLPMQARVGHVLRFHARLRGTPVHKARTWLERVGLSSWEGHPVGALSGGMRQRLAAALVFFHEPELIVMDEPRSNLDPQWRAELIAWVQEAASRGACLLVTCQMRRDWPSAAHMHRCEEGRVLSGAADGEGGP